MMKEYQKKDTHINITYYTFYWNNILFITTNTCICLNLDQIHVLLFSYVLLRSIYYYTLA